MFDYYRISMMGFFVLALFLCAVAPICLFWEPMMRIGLLYFYGPYVALLLWLLVVAMAVRVYRWRGLWLVATAIMLIPM